MSLRHIMFAMALVAPLGLMGCGGGGAKSETDIKTTTTGQELQDLKKAYDEGALTEEEYEREREKVLNQ